MNDEEEGSSQADSPITEEMRTNHVLRQAQLGRELHELNNMLQKKQELASTMQKNDSQMQEMRLQYEVGRTECRC